MVQQGVVLGHVISNKGLKVDKAKIKIIEKLTIPICIKVVRSFMGHVRFYHHFY
jgi:hypothetical protein